MALENQPATQENLQAIPGEQAPETGDQSTQQSASETSIEDRAREQGWKPKEEYEGDSSKWVSAETFVAKGELITRIESLGKKLKDSEKAISMLKEHHTRVKETEFKNAVAFLKAQKKEAYEQGDVDKIMEIDDKLAEVKETQRRQLEVEAQDVSKSGENHPDFQEWLAGNTWYNKDSDMRGDADMIGAAFKNRNPSKTPTEVLEHVTEKIKKMYPDKFQNQNRNRLSAVEGGTGTRQSSSRDDIVLSEDEKRVMNTFIRQGILTKEEYMNDIKKLRGAV